ncbi:MAG: hypothetical protein OXF86_00625 [Caldilineaceae bacterium]|nr:hypothetical protein [Caldilineaceae bacterium]
MGSGYVLDFNDESFGQFFKSYGVDIHSPKYHTYGTSKAKKLRAFWDTEPDEIVGRVLSEMLDICEALDYSAGHYGDTPLMKKCREIVFKLSGVPPETGSVSSTVFLNTELDGPDIQNLPVDSEVSEIIEDRLQEAQACLNVGAHLSVIILCGSVLEAVLLGAAQEDPKKFSRAARSPKGQDGKTKRFRHWSLSEFIDVAYDVKLLKQDVRKFSHELREFRNYIHPDKQMKANFKPSEHTAKICIQVLNAALADVSGERQ